MIEVSASLSNRIVKKGDYFSIYVDIINGHEDPITIREVKLFQPMGFIPIGLTKQSFTIFDAIKDFFKGKGGEFIIDTISMLSGTTDLRKLLKPDPSKKEREEKEKEASPSPNAEESKEVEPHEAFLGPSIFHKPKDGLVQSKTKFREDFNLKAGWTGGLRPRPDTYTISAEVTYVLKEVVFHKQINVDVSIFPSLSSMLFGALFGSILGTLVKGFLSSNGLLLSNIIPAFFINLVLGFVISVMLMRKKDVQPFLTIEDFWGGILLGFLVGTNGQTFLGLITSKPGSVIGENITSSHH